MAEIAMRVVLAGKVGKFTPVLVAVDQFGDEQVGKLPRDRDLAVDAKSRRNMGQHRLYWAMMGLIADAVDEFHDSEDASDFIKIAVRHCRIVQNPTTGNTFFVPKSMSEASMTSAQFARFFDRVMHYVTTKLVPGLKESEIRKRLEEMTTPRDGFA